jgi:hypothetical protein
VRQRKLEVVEAAQAVAPVKRSSKAETLSPTPRKNFIPALPTQKTAENLSISQKTLRAAIRYPSAPSLKTNV